MFETLISGIFLAAIGLLMVKNPMIFWNFTETWKARSPDEKPSELYIKLTKVGGVFFIVAGIAVAILPLFLM